MAMRTNPFILVLFSLLASAHPPPCSWWVHAAPKLVETVCRESQHHSFCVQALESDPKTPSAQTYMDLAVISLKLGISNAESTKAFLTRMHDSPKTDPSKKPALKHCISAYEGAVASFRSSLTELKEDAMTANYDAKVAGDGARTCAEALASGGVEDLPVSKRNDYVLGFSNVADVITTHLY